RPVPRGVRRLGDAGLRARSCRDLLAQPLLHLALRGPHVLGAPRPDLRRGRSADDTAGRAVIASWRRVLVLAPHTDDGEFGCGGTMARLVDAGADVRYVAFSIATKSLPAGY